MKFRTLFKIAVFLGMLAALAFTGMFAYHVMVRPLDEFGAKWIPSLGTPASRLDRDAELVSMLEASEMPDIDPGERVFQKAHELLALGKVPEARIKLMSIIRIYPGSPAAPAARKIISSMNLDELFSPAQTGGKQVHQVKRGDSWTSLTTRYRTTVECVMALNGILVRRDPQVDDEWLMMPLDFRLLVEPRRKAVSLWDGGRFVCEFAALEMPPQSSLGPPLRTKIKSRSAQIDGKRVTAGQREFSDAVKTLRFEKVPFSLRAWDGVSEKPRSAVLLAPGDMEEIFLLTRVGNEVEVR
jgi:hypothetical protein